MQTKVNRVLTSLGANLTSTDMSEGYITQSKSKASSVMHGTEENNALPLLTITSDYSEEALTGAATALSLLSLPSDNLASQNISQSPVKMKCYYHHTHHCFLDILMTPFQMMQ